jgi:hypothetical protein
VRQLRPTDDYKNIHRVPRPRTDRDPQFKLRAPFGHMCVGGRRVSSPQRCFPSTDALASLNDVTSCALRSRAALNSDRNDAVLSYLSLRFDRESASPISPTPNRARVAGSGTEVMAGATWTVPCVITL